MTMIGRGDGSHYPDHDAENAVLKDFGDDGNSFATHDGGGRGVRDWALGDLIEAALAGRALYSDHDEAPEAWESLEHAMLETTALELHALSRALEAGDVTTDDHDASETFRSEDAVALLNLMRRRLRAGAELTQRMRKARWGHPSFGGGEDRALQARAKREAVERGSTKS